MALKKLAAEQRAYDDKTLAYHGALMASIHEIAWGLHAAGVMDKRTLRWFDEVCLTPVRKMKRISRAPFG